MKNVKKIAGLLLTLAMVLAIAVPAFADGETPTTYTLTINDKEADHKYEAYQIFTGDLSTSSDTVGSDGNHKYILSNIKWGNGVNGAALLNDLTTIASEDPYAATKALFADCKTAADVAEALDKVSDDASTARDFAQIVNRHLTANVAGTSDTYDTANKCYTISGLTAGYYFVKDVAGTVGTDDAYTRFILKVVGDATVTRKADIPTGDKEVEDINDSTGDTGWGDSADYDIGDSINFRLTGTLPSNYGDYKTYKYIFRDTLSKGLTYNNDAKVYVVNGTTEYEITDQAVIDHSDVSASGSASTTGSMLTVTFDNLKAVTGVTIDKDSKIVVRYTATLNEDAVVGGAGNKNTLEIVYSNNPNDDGSGDTGTTPDDSVVVFTYKTIINKVDSENNPLTGAEFTLEKFIKDDSVSASDSVTGIKGNWVAINRLTVSEETHFTFNGLDDGTYRLTETKTPAGYNTIDPIVFTITSTHDETQITTLDGTPIEGSITFTADKAAGSLEADVVNNAGSILPSTGGIGTTLFYVFGALLVVGAGVLLVVRKRMSATK